MINPNWVYMLTLGWKIFLGFNPILHRGGQIDPHQHKCPELTPKALYPRFHTSWLFLKTILEFFGEKKIPHLIHKPLHGGRGPKIKFLLLLLETS